MRESHAAVSGGIASTGDRTAHILYSVESVWTRIASKRLLSCALVFALSLTIRLALLPLDPKPVPQVQDEFSYVFGGETLAMGRVANPTHPMWRFFETTQIIMQPTYVSKYPPGQAAFLALGIRLFGDPWYGVLISVALMCACLCWMLQGWLPPKYALLGALLALFHLGTAHYWVDSFWGGAVACIGGALVFGALPRLARGGSVSTACAAAIGVAILANSRPFEGLLLASLTFIALLVWTRGHFRIWFRLPVLLPFLLIGLIAGAAMVCYNFKTTGSPVTMPYTIYQQRYATTPIWWILPPLPPQHFEYRDSSMRELWESWDAAPYLKARRNPLTQFRQLDTAIQQLFGADLILVLLACAVPLVPIPRLRLAIGVLVLALLGMTLSKFVLTHYLAPAVAPLLVVMMFGARNLRCHRLRRPVSGLALLGSVLLFTCARTSLDKFPGMRTRRTDLPSVTFRYEVLQKLNFEPGQHLVLVHYSPEHSPHDEIVYNGPDIDSQKIIWAFDFGPQEDRPLLDYYKGRKVWLVQPDPPHPTLQPYSRD